MKQKLLWLVFSLAMAAHGTLFATEAAYPPELKPEVQAGPTAHLAGEVLSRYHYKKVPLDESLSGKIFDNYLKALDPEKLFFLQSDIDRFASERSKLGLAMENEDLSVPFAIFNLFEHRLVERFDYARALLGHDFDFGKNESYQPSREKATWQNSEPEMHDLWRKRVKNDWLKLKLAGKDDKSTREILGKRYENLAKRMSRMKSADVFQTYMNAYTMAIEPHTNYMGLRAAEDLEISMKLSLVGIGATLTELNDYPTIRELVPGGPASLSGQINVGDRIAGVAQGEGGAMTDLLGWRLDDAIALIRGTHNSVVRLEVLPADAGPDGKPKLVSLVRKTIRLQDQAAKSAVYPMVNGKTTHRIGVITLPSFYEDFDARRRGVKDYRSATRDVARLLDELKKQNVDSVLIDLRNDGGGSLAEAVELTSLFIGTGPVVQQRNASGEISVERATQASARWNGPLAVLINRSSASASEIFAAAIQDYGRGLIIGEPSFGKGTVQTVFNLDQLVKNDKPQLGELKMTIAQFFRINGSTTQLRGVTPDILFPSSADTENFGESSYDNALAWTRVGAADYSPRGDLKAVLPVLSALHEARVKKDADFQNLRQDLAELKLQREKNLISLNVDVRRKERDANEQRLKVRKPSKPVDGAQAPEAATVRTRQDDGLQAGERNLISELAAEKVQKNAKDVLLIEAVHILSDELKVLKDDDRLAAQVKPGTQLMPD